MNPRKFVLLSPEGKGIYATLDEAGVVTFVVEAGAGSSMRGTEMFNRMMRYFGVEARAIQGGLAEKSVGCSEHQHRQNK